MGSAASINATEIMDMVRHWLGCSANGYLGSDYRSDIKALLQQPFSAGMADDLIAKAREDIPLLRALPSDSINLYAEERGPDKLLIYMEVAGQVVTISTV